MCMNKSRQSYWAYPLNFANCFRTISLIIPFYLWFHNLYLSRKSTNSFFWLPFGHTLLLVNSFKLLLNNSQLCTLLISPSNCDAPNIFYNFPKVSTKRANWISLFIFYNVPLDVRYILSSQQPTKILHILSFSKYLGFII